MTGRFRMYAVLPAFFWCATAAAQKVGEAAPEINAPNYFGTEDHLSLAKFRGKVVVVMFWRHTNPPSLDALSKLNDIHKKLADSGVVVLAFTPDDKEQAESTAASKKLQYVVGFGGNIDEVYEVTSFPLAFIIDTRGMIAWKGDPSDDLEDRIRDQLRRTPSSGSKSGDLKKQLEQARKAEGAGEAGKAFALARSVADAAPKDGDLAKEATELAKKAEDAARRQLDEAKSSAASNPEQACRKVAEISVRFEGTEVGRAADEEIARMKTEANTKTHVAQALTNARAAARLEAAAELEAAHDFTAALAAYREVSEKHAASDSAAAAQKAVERLTSDPAAQKQIQAARASEEADRWLDLADRYAKVDMPDLARAQYEKVIKTHPDSPAAGKAKQRLAKLKKP